MDHHLFRILQLLASNAGVVVDQHSEYRVAAKALQDTGLIKELYWDSEKGGYVIELKFWKALKKAAYPKL